MYLFLIFTHTSGDSTFKGDYLWSLKQVLNLGIPTVVFLQDEFVKEVGVLEASHPLASIRGVQNVSYMCLYVYIYIYVCVCVYVYIYI